MSQPGPTPNEASADEQAGGQPGLPDEVTEGIGGVQGSDPDEDEDAVAQSATSGESADQPAPDAGEIEWAGQVVKKPPTPEN